MLTGKIDVTKIDKTYLFKGKSGTYLDIALIANKAGRDQYGNDGMIVQSVSKQARQEGKKGAILGNYSDLDQRPQPQQKKVSANDPLGPEDDIPFWPANIHFALWLQPKSSSKIHAQQHRFVMPRSSVSEGTMTRWFYQLSLC